MSIITKLTAILTADSAQFESGIKKARSSFSQFQSAIVKGVGLVSGAMATLGAAFLALGIRQAKVIGENVDLANSLGFTYREYQALSLVANESGVAQEQFSVALKNTQKAIFDAANGSKTMRESFDRIGLSVKDLIGLSPAEQFIKVGAAIGQISDPTIRTATALEIFGKGGRAIIPMLDDLEAKAKEADAFNQKFGLSLSQIDSSKVEESGDAFGRVGKTIEGAGNVIAVQFAPLITEMSNRFVDATFSADDFGKGVRKVMEFVAGTIDTVRKEILLLELAFKGVIAGVLEAAAKAKEALTGNGGVLRGAANGAAAEVRGVESELANFESTMTKFDKINEAADQRASKKKNAPTGADLETTLEAGNKKISEHVKKVKEAKDVWGEFGKSSGSAIDSLISDLGRGNLSLQSFRNAAVSVLQDVLTALNGGTSIGTTIGTLLGGVIRNSSASSAFQSAHGVSGSLGSTLGSLFASSTTGSFATGIQNVPYDMNARLHRGEAVIPASQVKSMNRDGGGSIINIDARGAHAGVEEKIRQVMNEVTSLRRDTPKIALNVVSDQNRRNPNFVR